MTDDHSRRFYFQEFSHLHQSWTKYPFFNHSSFFLIVKNFFFTNLYNWETFPIFPFSKFSMKNFLWKHTLISMKKIKISRGDHITMRAHKSVRQTFSLSLPVSLYTHTHNCNPNESFSFMMYGTRKSNRHAVRWNVSLALSFKYWFVMWKDVASREGVPTWDFLPLNFPIDFSTFQVAPRNFVQTK